MNQVQKIALNFSGEDESFFRSLYADWDHYWTTRLERATERVLEKYNDATLLVELDVLDLELGAIREADFETRFLPAYEEQLENALLKQLYGRETTVVRKKKVQKSKSELLFYFLLHGSFPWNADSRRTDLNTLFLEVAATESNALRTFLRTYGHYTSLQQRLVFQFDETVLREGVRLVAPGESHFILSYVTFVQSKHQQLRSPQISRTLHYQAVWQVVYAYLLTNRSSFFNKKSFLEQTIRQLANRYLITYPVLLQLLLLNNQQGATIPNELLKLLRMLKKEEAHSIRGDSNWKKWIPILVAAERMSPEFLPEERTLLVKLLRSDRNYLLLRLLRESQILKLVETVAPQHHPFVKTYAKELDQQKEQGMLQGKAGGEFRLVKWQIIFPILLQNTGAGFNRHQFVERVLRKVAGHYNLKLVDLLYYLMTDTTIAMTDRELAHIFSELYLRLKAKKEIRKSTSASSIPDIIRALSKKQELSFEVRNEWLTVLKNEASRNKLLQQLSEKEHRQLIRILYQAESPFILSYATAIEQQKNKGLLQGKTSGNFSTLKWQFIHAVILEPQQQVFNKRYFVEQVLRKMAAHHNLKTEELIAFFYTETNQNGITLPFELINLLKMLYQEMIQKQQHNNQQQVILEISEETPDKIAERTATERLLIHYFGDDKQLAVWIRRLAQHTDFVRFAEPLLQIEAELRQFISTQLKQTIDKRQLLLILLRMSGNYASLNKAAILHKIIAFLFNQLTDKQQQDLFQDHLEKLALRNDLLKKSLVLSTDSEEKILTGETEKREEELISEGEEQPLSFISNAGLILLAPFLPQLFRMLQLTENGAFKNRDAKIRAIFLMQYAVFKTTEFPEYELQLNKLLTGFKTGIPLPRSVELTEQEMKTADGMLQGVVQHWNKVKTIDGLREGFLQREGKLDDTGEIIELIVETKAFDMLLDAVPWNFRTTKFSWMEKTIHVKWR